ncbi:MAG: IS4 family transposase [Candidatus Competibacteraceae bacterium]
MDTSPMVPTAAPVQPIEPPSTVSKPEEAKLQKRSSVRHTRAIQRDRTQRPLGAPPAAAVVARLTEIVHPATLAQVSYFHGLGLRARLLTLPVMVALVLNLLWRQIGSINELVRVVRTEAVWWVPPLRELTQQALAQRLRTLPAVAWAQAHFTAVLIADGSTLDVLLRRIGLLRDAVKAPLAGRMMAVLDLASRLPRRVWYDADPHGHDARFWDRLVAAIPTGALVVFDLGFTDFARWATLTARGVTWLTRAKKNLKYEVAQVLVHTSAVRDRLVWIGKGATRQPVRLIEVQAHGTVYRYLTNALDLTRLPTAQAVALYRQRWRVEDAFSIVKRLLGLAYFYSGAENAIQMQLWATWLLYAVLIDLTDAVAEALARPFAEVSVEMVYRSLYFVTNAVAQDPTTDPVRYLADHARELGIIKRPRKKAPHERPPTTSKHLHFIP